MTFSSKSHVNLKQPEDAAAGSLIDSILRNAVKVKEKLVKSILLLHGLNQHCMLSRKDMLQDFPCFISLI